MNLKQTMPIALLTFVSANTLAIEVPGRGADFFDTPERFNRHYTDPQYSPAKTYFVSPDGDRRNSGSRTDPLSVDEALKQVMAGEEVRFLPGKYQGCWQLDESNSGTYDAPIVLKAEPGVEIDCCNSGRKSCFNLEFTNYVAVDGFTLKGGDYGVRTVGGYATSEHQEGIAILNNRISGQYKDPILSGGSDWIVVENNIASDSGKGDGHGIYLSNGGDWMIVRKNETFNTPSSDFQINADPISTCEDEGIKYSNAKCNGSALDGLGAGVSEFILVEANYFHDSSVGPNLTSVRNSVFRNNVVAFHSRHGTSFWQETNNAKLGSSNNIVEHNLFIGEKSGHVLQFINKSVDNQVRNNLLLAVTRKDASVNARSNTLLLEQDRSTEETNEITGNYFVGGYFEYFSPDATNVVDDSFDTSWHTTFPLAGDIAQQEDFKPTSDAPFVGIGLLLDTTPHDIEDTSRTDPTDLGPWQISATILPPPTDTCPKPDAIIDTIECDAIEVPAGSRITTGSEATLKAVHYVSFGNDFRVERDESTGKGGVLRIVMSGVSP